MFFGGGSGAEWLIVFLGNPGRQYEGSRHNAGFMAAEALEKENDIRINRARFRALTAVAGLGGAKVMLMKPQTYMNLSGEAVVQAVRFYKIPPERVIVISDEMSLPVGRIRVRASGSAGGHNGLKNIISHLGTDAFPRIRIGVGEPPREEFDPKDWVLSGFHGKDAEAVMKAADAAQQAAVYYIRYGADKTMSRFNGFDAMI